MSITYIFLLLVCSSLANNMHRKISNILLINEKVTFYKYLKQNFLKSTGLERDVLLEVQMVRENKTTYRQLHLFQFQRLSRLSISFRVEELGPYIFWNCKSYNQNFECSF